MTRKRRGRQSDTKLGLEKISRQNLNARVSTFEWDYDLSQSPRATYNILVQASAWYCPGGGSQLREEK